MRISLIAAMSENGVIGKGNTLPWHLPEELKYFRKMTAEKPVIMGRKTFESIGNKPLPKRHNIILTRSVDLLAEGCTVVHTVEQALAAANACEEVMIIGGANIYQLFLPLATRLYLTQVHEQHEGDAFFPPVNWAEWKCISEQKYQEFTTKIWDRKER